MTQRACEWAFYWMRSARQWPEYAGACAWNVHMLAMAVLAEEA